MSEHSELPPGLSAAVRDRFNALSPQDQARVLARLDERLRQRSGIPRRAEPSAPLTFAQQRVWFLQQLAPESPSFNQSHTWRLQGRLDLDALARSLSEIVRRHEILRTRYLVVDGELRQEPTAPVPLLVETLDARELSGDEPSIAAFEQRLASAPFDLASAPMIRAGVVVLAADQYRLVVTRHHIASDRWSSGLFLTELSTAYEAFRAGRPPTLPELPIQYADYAVWARARADQPTASAALASVIQALDGASHSLSLVPGLERPVDSERGGRAWGRLGPDAVMQLRALVQANGATLFMGLLAIFSTLVHRYTDATDLVLGTPIAGRVHSDTERLIGLVSNMLAVRLDLSGDPSFLELLARARLEVMRAFDCQEVPFERVLEALRPERGAEARTPLTPLVFALQNVPYEGLRLAGLEVEEVDAPIDAFAADVGLITWESAGELVLRADYNADLFSDALIGRMLTHFAVLTEAVVHDPQTRLSQLALLTDGERHDLVVTRNATTTDFPQRRRIDELFEDQEAQRPGATAVIDDGRQLTYRELKTHADRIARRLRAVGVGRGDRVALLLKGSWVFVAAVLGTYKAGAAYVAIDPDHAPVRRRLVLQDAEPKATIVEPDSRTLAPPGSALVLVPDQLDEEDVGGVPEEDRGTSEDVACVLYTSGSTGVPKGVLTPHRSVVNHSSWIAHAYGVGHADRVLQASPFSFDASMWELTMPLITGGAVVMGSPLGRIDPPAFLASIIEHGITSLLLVPAQIPFLLDRPELDACVSLRNVFVGGEVFPAQLAARLAARIPARIHNIYGPTETCVNSTMHEWQSSDSESGTVPIGRPIANTEVYVLDARGELLPVGIPGELYIGGSGLSHGYLHAPDLTARRFVAHPFKPEARLYRTGDRVCWREDGRLTFVGRLDDQFKLRGIRIESGEIEAALVAHPSVAAAAVVVRGEGESARLIAFLVARRDADGRPDSADLRTFLRDRVPEVMVPTAYQWLDELPLSPHGKVDRTALPDVVEEAAVPSASPVATTTEARLRALWLETLNRRDVGPDVHFFDAGGNSLLAVRLFARIEDEFGIRLRISKLFEGPTIRALARAIDSSTPASWTPLVPIRPNGTRPPLYVVHGIGGEVLTFEPLARALPVEQPVFGFESDIWDGREVGTIADTAAFYLDVLERTQANGPYYLAGYSSGGALAFEMACQLEAAGRQVGLLILIDAGIPPRALNRVTRAPIPPAQYLHHFLHWVVDDLLTTPAAMLYGRVKSKSRMMMATARARFLGGRDAAMIAEEADVRDRLGMWKYPREYRRHLETRWAEFARYEPGRFSGRAIVIRSRTGRLMRPRRVLTGWEPLITGGIQQHMLRGSHDNILREPQVRELARLVMAGIERSTTSADSAEPV
jgi:amino acid adenylation domain-containing protein